MTRAITPKDQQIDNEKGNLGFSKCQQSLRVGHKRTVAQTIESLETRNDNILPAAPL